MIGRHLQDLSKKADENTEFEWIWHTRKDADLVDEAAFRRYVSELQDSTGPVDGILHLAARVGGLFDNREHQVEMLEDNLRLNTTVLRVAHERNIQTVVCVLSSCVFPAHPPGGFPMRIGDLHGGPCHYSNEGYAMAKRICEVHCRAYRNQYGRAYHTVIPVNLFGEYDCYEEGRAHVIPDLIRKFCDPSLPEGASVAVRGTGIPLRQFVYAGDFACFLRRTLLRLLSDPSNACRGLPEDYVGCAGPVMSIREVAEQIAALCPGHHTAKFENVVADDGCLEKTLRETRNFSFTPFEEALQRTIRSFVSLQSFAKIRDLVGSKSLPNHVSPGE